MLHLVKDCLKDTDTKHPSAQQIWCLSALKEASQYVQSLEVRGREERGRRRKGGREGKLQERDEFIKQLREENKAREREVENIRGKVRVKEGEIETLRSVIRESESDTRVTNEEIEHLRRVLQDKDQTIYQLQFSPSSYACLVSGPVLQSATTNHPTHVVVKLGDSSGRRCSLKQNVTAELVMQSSSQVSPTDHSQQSSAAVAMISPSRYEVSYTAVRQGLYKLHILVNGSKINDSPFTITAYPDPTQIISPVRIMKGLNKPYDITFNSHGEMIVSENRVDQVSVFDVGGRMVRMFGFKGDRPEQMISPAGIAVDDMDNVYVSSDHKLQKFTSRGELIKCIGRNGSKKGEFDDPRGVTIHSNQVHVCDLDNHRIQVFDLDLNLIGSIRSCGSGRGEFVSPFDIAFDTDGNKYVVENGSNRVQVMDSSGRFIRMFSQEGEDKLRHPTALHIADKYVYVSDWSSYRIAVYETSGQYVTSFGEFGAHYYITYCVSGFIYVCDCHNN